MLGRLEAHFDGVELDLGPRKQRALLALLLLNANRVMSMESQLRTAKPSEYRPP